MSEYGERRKARSNALSFPSCDSSRFSEPGPTATTAIHDFGTTFEHRERDYRERDGHSRTRSVGRRNGRDEEERRRRSESLSSSLRLGVDGRSLTGGNRSGRSEIMKGRS